MKVQDGKPTRLKVPVSNGGRTQTWNIIETSAQVNHENNDDHHDYDHHYDHDDHDDHQDRNTKNQRY